MSEKEKRVLGEFNGMNLNFEIEMEMENSVQVLCIVIFSEKAGY